MIAICGGLTALGAVATQVIIALRPSPAKPEEVVRVEKVSRSRDKDQNLYLEGAAEDQQIRNQILLAFLCQQNSSVPIARGIDCPELKCEPAPVMKDGKITAKKMACKIDIAWPPERKPPR